MRELPYPDRLHLAGAIGWLELGNPTEANLELEPLRWEACDHPDVLVVRWHIHFRKKQWATLKHISARLAGLEPLNPESWLLHANSYYFAGQYEHSYEITSLAVQQFPDDWRFHYEMACCAARLGKQREVESCLRRALDLGGDACLNPK